VQDVDKRVETCRAELQKAKDKKEKERLQGQLKLLEAERATLVSQSIVKVPPAIVVVVVVVVFEITCIVK
jgi:hypothetical protein